MSSGSSNDLPAGASFPVFSPDGRWLFLRREKSPGVELMKCGTWSVARAWDFNWRTVFPIFSHDGRFLFVRGASRAADSERQSARNYLLIDTESNQERTLLLPEKTTVSSARFSPEGRLLAIATSDLLVRVFELPSGKLFTTISVDFVAGPMVFSHASHYLGMASGSGAPRVFELPSGVEVSRAGLDEKERLLAFHFSRDERSLFLATTSPVSGEAAVEKSQEAAIKRQYLFAEELIKQSCSRMSRNLTAEEWKSYLPDYPYERTCPDLADVH